MPDQIIEVIDSTGKVVDVVDAGAGPQVTVIDGERIIDIIGATGQNVKKPGDNLVLSYSPSGELTSVEALPSGRVTDLSYTGGLLTSVTNYKGTRTLGYTDGVLTSVTWN